MIASGSENKNEYPGVAQLGSALDWGSRGRGFKSRHSDQKSTRAIGLGCFFIFGWRDSTFGLLTPGSGMEHEHRRGRRKRVRHGDAVEKIEESVSPTIFSGTASGSRGFKVSAVASVGASVLCTEVSAGHPHPATRFSFIRKMSFSFMD